MLQSGVGSMQGSNEDCLPMKGHTQGGTHPQCNPTNGHTYFQRGGDAPTMKPNELTHIFSKTGGCTHNVNQRTDTHIFKRN